MAVHFGWYGSRGTDTNLPTPSPVTRQNVIDFMKSTNPDPYLVPTFDVYMSYGVDLATDMNNYHTLVQEIIGIEGILDDQGNPQLLLQLPIIALNDIQNGVGTAKVLNIEQTYNTNVRVWGYYIEEPNLNDRWSPATVATACGVLTKPVVVNIRSNELQSEYNSYAQAFPTPKVDILSGFHYPLAQNTAEWANISTLGDYFPNSPGPDALIKVRTAAQANGINFWFAAQAYTGLNPSPPHFDTRREPIVQGTGTGRRSPELKWITHRILVEGGRGVLLYHFNRSYDNLHFAEKYMGDQIQGESTNRALDTTPKDNYYQVTGKAQLVSSSGGAIAWTYHYFGNSYWLVVVDKTPDITGVGTRSYTFNCDLETFINNFQFLQERYDNPGSNLTATRVGSTSYMQFSHQMQQGGVKLYRFFCGP